MIVSLYYNHPSFNFPSNNDLLIEVSFLRSHNEKQSYYCYILADKRSEKPMNGMHVCGQTIVGTSMYYSKKTTTGTIGIVRYSKRYVYYGKKTTTGTVGIVLYSKIKRSKVQ